MEGAGSCRQENREFIEAGIELSWRNSKLFLVNSDLKLAREEGADRAHLSPEQDLAEVLEPRRAGPEMSVFSLFD